MRDDDRTSRLASKAVWTAPAFCAFLSVTMLALPSGAAAPVFYSFLPLCFFFVSMVQLALWKRLDALARTGPTAGSRES